MPGSIEPNMWGRPSTHAAFQVAAVIASAGVSPSLRQARAMMKGIEGVESIEGRAETGRAQVTLEFRVGQNMDRAILLVSNRLDQVSGYPDEVKRPQIKTRGTEDNAIAYFTVTKLPTNKPKRPVYTYGDFIEDQVVERIERIPGVGGTNFFGGSNRELRVVVEPAAWPATA